MCTRVCVCSGHRVQGEADIVSLALAPATYNTTISQLLESLSRFRGNDV